MHVSMIPQILYKTLANLWEIYVLDTAVACALLWVLLKWIRVPRRQVRTTSLRGPPRESFVYGVAKKIIDADNPGDVYEEWARSYGSAFEIPSTLGRKQVILCDPKAIAHFLARDTWSYEQIPASRKSLETIFGKGLIWSQGESHKRQRRSLTPAFGITAIRELTSVFYESAYKAKGAWDALIESSGQHGTIIDVQNWMNHISLEGIGLAGFSHDFGALEGIRSPVTEILDTFGATSRSSAPSNAFLLLIQRFPFLVSIPTARGKLFHRFNIAMEEIADGLLARTKKELEMGVGEGKKARSVVDLLIKGAANSEFNLTKDEMVAQMRLLIFAGYETTSTTLTWALLELSQNPDVQTKLRNELLEHNTDPTYDQLELNNGFPYLDAVVHETLRVHPPVIEITRVAVEDDIIPLSESVCTGTGELVDNLIIAEGTVVSVSIEMMNRSVALWGDDAKTFRPSRWLGDVHGQDGLSAKVKDISGHRHLLTFSDGPRICLGRNFALVELKAVLTVLVKNFVFELREGDVSKVEMWRGLISRPRIMGEVGCKLPMYVQPYAA